MKAWGRGYMGGDKAKEVAHTKSEPKKRRRVGEKGGDSYKRVLAKQMTKRVRV